MKVFVINLMKDKEKIKLFSYECDQAGLNYEIINAVDGSKLSHADLDKLVRDHKKNYLTKGEIGCSLSHLSVYKKMVLEDIPLALICEDDAKIDKETKSILIEIEKIANPQKKQAFMLQTCKRTFDNRYFDLNNGYTLKESHGPRGNHGYIITKAAAATLLSINTPVMMASDDWLYFYFRSFLKTYSLNKNLIATIDDDKSLSNLEKDRLSLTEEQINYRNNIAESGLKYYLIKIYHKMIRRIFLRKIKKNQHSA